MKRKTIKYSVSAALLATMIQAAPTFAASSIDTQMAQTKGQITQTQGQINQTQSQIDNLETKIQQMDNQIIIGMVKSQQLSGAINAQQGQIKKAKAEVGKDKKDLETHKEIYSERLRSIQAQGQSPIVTYAELLLTSKNLSEFLTRSTAISEILQSDSDIMTTLNEKEQTLQNAEQQLNNELDNLKNSQDELTSEQQVVESVKQQVEKEVADNKNVLQQQEGQLSQQQSQLTQQQGEKAAQQQAVARQQALLAEQQAQQQAQAQQAAQQSSSNNSTAASTSSSNSSSSAVQVPVSSASASASQVISYAEQFLGVPYVWGGTTPSGFDCSGFMQYVYLHAAGIQLPRVAMDQQNAGTRISPYNVQPGDLIFMGDPAYHVGMYIGNGEWIEAPETGEVIKIVAYNPAHFSSAARIL